MTYKQDSIQYTITLNNEEHRALYKTTGQAADNNKFSDFLYHLFKQHNANWERTIYGNELNVGISFILDPIAAEEAVKNLLSDIKHKINGLNNYDPSQIVVITT